MESQVLTLEEAAALARCGLDCLREYVDAGEIPATRLDQKRTVQLREELIDFIRNLGRKSKPRSGGRPSRRDRGRRGQASRI